MHANNLFLPILAGFTPWNVHKRLKYEEGVICPAEEDNSFTMVGRIKTIQHNC